MSHKAAKRLQRQTSRRLAPQENTDQCSQTLDSKDSAIYNTNDSALTCPQGTLDFPKLCSLPFQKTYGYRAKGRDFLRRGRT